MYVICVMQSLCCLAISYFIASFVQTHTEMSHLLLIMWPVLKTFLKECQTSYRFLNIVYD